MAMRLDDEVLTDAGRFTRPALALGTRVRTTSIDPWLVGEIVGLAIWSPDLKLWAVGRCPWKSGVGRLRWCYHVRYFGGAGDDYLLMGSLEALPWDAMLSRGEWLPPRIGLGERVRYESYDGRALVPGEVIGLMVADENGYHELRHVPNPDELDQWGYAILADDGALAYRTFEDIERGG